MARSMNWERARQRDIVKGRGSIAKSDPAPPKRPAMTAKQRQYLLYLCESRGERFNKTWDRWEASRHIERLKSASPVQSVPYKNGRKSKAREAVNDRPRQHMERMTREQRDTRRDLDAALDARVREVAEDLRKARGQEPPPSGAEVRAMRCPRCNAKSGQRCRGTRGLREASHIERWNALNTRQGT